MEKVNNFMTNLPKLHPILWLMLIGLFTVYVWAEFPIIVALYYIFVHDKNKGR